LVEVFSKIIVASAISCAEALQLFTTKLALKTNYTISTSKSVYFLNDEIKAFAQTCMLPDAPLYESVAKLSEKIFTEFEFQEQLQLIRH
jgi:hypothetical protein